MHLPRLFRSLRPAPTPPLLPDRYLPRDCVFPVFPGARRVLLFLGLAMWLAVTVGGDVVLSPGGLLSSLVTWALVGLLVRRSLCFFLLLLFVFCFVFCLSFSVLLFVLLFSFCFLSLLFLRWRNEFPHNLLVCLVIDIYSGLVVVRGRPGYVPGFIYMGIRSCSCNMM